MELILIVILLAIIVILSLFIINLRKSLQEKQPELSVQTPYAKATEHMTPRDKIVWVDIHSDVEVLKKAVLENQFSYYPVCEGDLDKVKGIISIDVLLGAFISDKKMTIENLMYKPLIVPEHLTALQVFVLFKKNYIQMGMVIDEYGHVLGIVTVTDILQSIVGDIPQVDDTEEKQVIRRNHNSWLIDGLLSTSEFKARFHFDSLPDEKEAGYNTIAGFVMHKLGKLPVPGDHFTYKQFRFEVADMDGNRVDKIMLVKEGSST